MKKVKGIAKKTLALLLAVALAVTGFSTGGKSVLTVRAADNAPSVTYSFTQIQEMTDIPVMNLTMADADQYDTLKTVKDKQNISKFELANIPGSDELLVVETRVDEETGETTYPLTAKGRGNSSWTMATGKKPYNLKFDKKIDLLGMDKNKSWCLIANWVDTTFIRNYMAYKLACSMGMGTPDCEIVALCINDRFEGIYLLTEKVGLNDSRTVVPVGENDGDMNGDGEVTEIILEADSRAVENEEPGRFQTNSGVYFVPKDPDPEDLKDTELAEIEKEINAMEAAVMSGTNYDQYIDVDSWVDTYIINELAKNPDFGFGYQPCYSSTYLYFREGGKVYAGPVWDFDIAYGRNDYSNMEAEGNRKTADPEGFLTQSTKYYKELFENTDFEERVIERWKEISAEILPEWKSDTLDTGNKLCEDLAALDFEIWGDYSSRVAGSFDVGRSTLDFAEETAYIKSFIKNRISWLDTQWNVDEIEKKYSGTWTRWDVDAEDNYASYEALAAATDAGTAKTAAEDIWDGGYGGTEKAGTELEMVGERPKTGVALNDSVTLTMDSPGNTYVWWKDGEAAGGFGNPQSASLTAKESGRYIGVNTKDWWCGIDETISSGSKKPDDILKQIYIVDVGTDGSVTVHDGQIVISTASRVASITETNYAYIEGSGNSYTVSFKEDQSGNCGITLGGEDVGIGLAEDIRTTVTTNSVSMSVYEAEPEEEIIDILEKDDGESSESESDSEAENQPELEEEGLEEEEELEEEELEEEELEEELAEEEISANSYEANTASVGETVQTGVLKVTNRPSHSYYNDVPLKQQVTYIQVYGKKPASWTVAGDSVQFDENTYKAVAQKAGETTITAKYDDGSTSTVVITVIEETAESIEYDSDGTRGKYFGNNGDNQLTATAEEKGFWATIEAGKLTRFNYQFDLTAEQVTNAVDFTWKTADGNEIIGGTGDYYVFVNSKPLFAATADDLNYDSLGFTAADVLKISDVSADDKITLTEGKYAYLNNMAASTEQMLDDMTKLIQEGINNLDIFINMPEGGATVHPYLCGNVKLASSGSEETPDNGDDEKTEENVGKMDFELGFRGKGDSWTISDVYPSVLYTTFSSVDVPDKSVTWECSDASILTIMGNGVLVPKKPGIVTVRATSKYNEAVYAEIEITVKPIDVTVKIVSTQYATAGNTVELEATVSPDVYNKEVKWSIIAGADCAELSAESNQLKATKEGTVTVQATSIYNSNCIATAEIEIAPGESSKIIYAPVYSKDEETYPTGAVVYYPGDESYYCYTNYWGTPYYNTETFPGTGWRKVETDLSQTEFLDGSKYYQNDWGVIIKKDGYYYTPLGNDYWEHWISTGKNNAYWSVIPEEYSKYFVIGTEFKG